VAINSPLIEEDLPPTFGSVSKLQAVGVRNRRKVFRVGAVAALASTLLASTAACSGGGLFAPPDNNCPISLSLVSQIAGAPGEGTVQYNDWTTVAENPRDDRNCRYGFDERNLGIQSLLVEWSPVPEYFDLSGAEPLIDEDLQGVFLQNLGGFEEANFALLWEQDGLVWRTSVRSTMLFVPDTVPLEVLYETTLTQAKEVVQQIRSVTFTEWWESPGWS